MRAKSRVYSLLLLLILIFSIGGASALCLTHCHRHSDHANHHHCDSDVSECEGHTSALRHSCAVESETVILEYIPSGKVGGGEVKIRSISMLFERVDIHSNKYIIESEPFDFDQWCQYDLYLGFSPSLGLLRAPPALV